MANINVAGTGNFATIKIAYAGDIDTDAITLPGLQDVTVNNSNGQYRWKQLDTSSEFVVSTVATNQVTFNMVLDPDTFYGTGVGTGADADGVFSLSNNKTEVDIRVYWQGTDSGSKYVEATGYITGLSPTVNPDAPVWVSPITIDVSGNFTQGTVA